MSFIQSQGSGVAPIEEREAYDPTTLGAMSLWLDFDDSSHVWQDTAATTPAAAFGDVIKRVDDKSGNGFHFTNSVTATSPVLASFEGTKKCADFGLTGLKYLQTALASSLSFMYTGSPYTALISFKKLGDAQFQPIFDSCSFNSAQDGLILWLYNPNLPVNEVFLLQMNNSFTHSSGSGKSSTSVQDAEYIQVSSNLSNRGHADGVVLFGCDVTSGYVQVNNNVIVNTAAVGSPASGAGTTKATLGAAVGSYGWYGYIRRVWIWPSWLSANDRQTAMTKIQL